MLSQQKEMCLVLRVSRDNLVRDTLAQLPAHVPKDFKKPLKVGLHQRVFVAVFYFSGHVGRVSSENPNVSLSVNCISKAFADS